MINQILEILFEEDNPRIVAIYGGGFKPPTKGHFAVAKKILEQFPEIDELKIFVGAGVRNGISQEESLAIWNIYKKYLSDKVSIEPSPKGEPTMDVIRYTREHPEEKVYWILGAREGDEGDVKDVEQRTGLLDKYPNVTNVEVKIITSSGGVSGTKTRQAVKTGNKEQFFSLIPDVEEKEEIWDIVSSTVKEVKNRRAEIIKEKKAIMTAKKSLEEGFIENTQENIKKLLLAIKQEGKETRDAFKLVLQAAKGEIQLTDEQKKQIGDQLKDVLKTIGLVSIATLPGGFVVGALIKIFKAERLVFPSSLLPEIGDASAKTYSYSGPDPSEILKLADEFFKKGTSSSVFGKTLTYKFSTDKANYDVRFQVEVERQTYINFSGDPNWKPGPKFKTYTSVGFNITGDEEEKDTNLNEQFSVLSTVTKIIFDFIDKINEAGGNLVSLTIAPKSDTDKEAKLDSKRGRFYAAYIEKNLSKYPGYDTKKGKDDFGNEYIEIYKKDTVNEVGEANLKPYKWEEVDVEGYFVYTSFITDSETEYNVDLESKMYIDDDFNNLRALGVEFAAKPKGAEGSSTKIVVNKGELYKVMATIVDIVKKYVKKSKAQVILYSPAKKSSEEDFGSQRDNLYKTFISKAFPGVKFEQEGEVVAAILPKNQITEGKQVGPLYHYTSADGLKGILSSNRINASEEYYLGNDLYYISFTRNKNFHNKGSKFGVKTDYRITLDGDKLSNRYKITPFAYKPGWNYEDNWEYDWLEDEPESVVRDFFNNTGDYDEQEERISFKGPEGGIDNIKNYILAVDKVEDLQENIISETMTVYRLGEIPYDEKSFFVTPDYKTWIKFYPGEEIHKITTNKLYLPLRSKSFSSWDELRSKYDSGEFTDDDVSYINPEESGIQDFEQYEIKPDDIIDLEQINLEEGRKKKPDPKKGTGKKPEGSGRRLYTDEDPKDTVRIKFKTKEDIVDTLNKKQFKAKSHARQSQVINLIHQRVRAAYGKAKDPEVKSRLKRALDYIEGRKESSKKKTERLRKMKEASDPQAGTALPYGSGFAPIKESDPFGLNEFAKQFVKEVFEEGWNFEEGMVSLTKYMIDNGMNIKPLPKIKVIDNDKDNASKLLGKTAHYDPVEKSITLFTMNRHPKDVLRSFAHEMIHHEQNLENKLGNISTTNTNEGGDLPEIEREAYEKGNMMLRNWEDSIKAEKYLKEYKQKALTELFEKDLPYIKKINQKSYIVGNGNDIEAKFYFNLEIPEKDIWSVYWFFTENNKNTSPEAWKQVTATSFKVLDDFLKSTNPKSIHISGNTGTKTKLYKNYIEKLQTLLNNKYKIDNSDEDKVVLRSIEEIAQSGIKKRMETLNESYQQSLSYWQNGDINSKSKIERWDSIKKKIQREVLCELYNIKNV